MLLYKNTKYHVLQEKRSNAIKKLFKAFTLIAKPNIRTGHET